MCGRFTLTNPGQLSLRFAATSDGGDELQPRFNIAPSQLVPAIVEGPQARAVEQMRWGFRPAWAGEDRSRPAPINARAETLMERPLFRGAVTRGRCLIPADGFYEWQVVPGQRTKQPMYIRLRDGSLFGFAGLYTETQDEAGDPLRTCAIITCTPNELMAPIHNRMPAILDPAQEALWLDPAVTDPLPVLACLRPYPASSMEAYPVGRLVSAPQHEGPELIRHLPTA
jgi:putative SOS response-associated peptidase YedK